MTKAEINQLIHRWNAMQKYITVRKNIEKSKNNINVMDASKVNEYIRIISEDGLTDQILESNCDSIINYFEDLEMDKSMVEDLVIDLTELVSKNDLVADFIKSCITWLVYLRLKVNEENFELAYKINRCLEIEKTEFFYIYEKHYPLTYDEDKITIEQLYNEYKDAFL